MKRAVTILIGLGVISAHYISFTQHEYVYPVASLIHSNEKHLYLIHQTASNHIDLLLWNPRTKETQKMLLSRFTPAGLQIVPGDKGFSFIDHDTLRVKMHHKRSPQLIDFEEPLYDFTIISWIDEITFYFSARSNDMFGIYQASLQGHCDCIIASDDYDCLYPQKINDVLFYIERDKEFSHKIVSIPYLHLHYQVLDPVLYIYQQRKTEPIKKEYYQIPRRTVLDLGKKSIAFLHMINESEGFFIEHPATVEKNDVNITFLYHYMYRTQDERWSDRVLFSFSIPAHYLIHLDNGRLYESILPLLPQYTPGYGILFVDSEASSDHSSLGIQLYDNKDNKVVSNIYAQENQSFFGIFVVDGVVYYGGTVTHDDVMRPRMWLEDGVLFVDLPNDLFFT